MSISFFTYQNLLGPKIRGEEIAAYLGAAYNSKRNGREVRADVNIHVKPKSLDNVPDGDWVDITDGEWVPELLASRPQVKAIAGSLYTYEKFSKMLPNEMVWISQQHLNWDRLKRDRKAVTTCGYIGGPSWQARDYYGALCGVIKEHGYEWTECFDFVTKQDAIDFYKSIDILIVMHPGDDRLYKTPTKLINAASFGIPAIAYPARGYKEWEGNYIKAKTLDEMLEGLAALRDTYGQWPDKIMEASEYFHISNVARRYEELDDLHQGR